MLHYLFYVKHNFINFRYIFTNNLFSLFSDLWRYKNDRIDRSTYETI